MRRARGATAAVLLINLSERTVMLDLPAGALGDDRAAGNFQELITGTLLEAGRLGEVHTALAPFGLQLLTRR